MRRTISARPGQHEGAGLRTVLPLFLIVALQLGALGATAQSDAPSGSVVGIWSGSPSIPNSPAQRLALEVKSRADGALAADLIFLDDGASGTPSSSVRFSDGVLRVETRRPSRSDVK